MRNSLTPQQEKIEEAFNEIDTLRAHALYLAQYKIRVRALTILLSSDGDHFDVSMKGSIVTIKYIHGKFRRGVAPSVLDAIGEGAGMLDALETCARDLKQNLTLLCSASYLIIRRSLAGFEENFGELS